MAKYTKRKQRRNRNFVAIPFEVSIPLGTLGNGIVICGDLLGADLGEDIYVLSIDGLWSIRELTAGEQPIQVGYAHKDLTVTEIKEATEAEVTDPDDIIAKERARRPVRRAGVFAKGAEVDYTLAHGEHIRTKMKFSVGNGHNICIWAKNKSGSTLTTGGFVQCSGTLYGRWQR